jgi:amino acid transporter
VQGAIAVALIVGLGSFIGAVLYTAAAVYGFYLATTLAVIVLRRKDPQRPRAFRVPGYPLTPLVFAGTCAALIWSAVTYRPALSGLTFLLALSGLPVWWLGRRLSADTASQGR